MEFCIGLILLGMILLNSVGAPAAVPGSAGMYADAAGAVSGVDVVPGVPFNVYVVAFDPPGGMLAYEVGIEGIPENVFVLMTTIFGPIPCGWPLRSRNLCQDFD